MFSISEDQNRVVSKIITYILNVVRQWLAYCAIKFQKKCCRVSIYLKMLDTKVF